MPDVGEQTVDFPQSVTTSDDGNPSCVDDFPDLPNLLLKLKHEIGKKSLTLTEESYRNYKVNVIV